MNDPENEAATLERHTAAMIRLRRIPGVVRVAFGLKQTGGQILQQWAYRVYVQRKRPLAELPPGERIPPEIDGVKTDVLYADEIRATTKTPSMAPSDSISRLIPNTFQASGTLGLIVRNGADRFILTNKHVLDDDHETGNTAAQDVYDPHLKECAGIKCNNPIAHIIPNKGIRANHDQNGTTYFVDATLAAVNAGVDGANVISGVGPLDQGLRNLATVPLSGSAPADTINVKKRGATTGLTQGRVIEMNHLSDDGSSLIWEMRVAPTSGFAYHAEYELADDAVPADLVARFTGSVHATSATSSSGRPTIRLSGSVMSLPGDSGSIVVDDQRHIVGLLWGSNVQRVHVVAGGQPDYEFVSTGDAVICYIHPVFDAMGLDPATAVVPIGHPSAGIALMEPGLDAGPAVSSAWPGAALRELEAVLARAPRGQLLLDLLSRHYGQIAYLVHHRRRITVSWHRNRGPAYAAVFLEALRDPSGRLPAEIGGIRLADAIVHFRDALSMEGDEALRKDLHTLSDLLLDLAGHANSLPELVRTLSGPA